MGEPAEEVRELERKVRSLLDGVALGGGLVAGSLYMSRTRCGRRACKCMASDYRHENRCLSFTEGGRSRTRTVPDRLAEAIGARTVAYRHARALRQGIARTAAELLEGVDRIIAEAARTGRRDMLAALAEAKKGSK